MKTVERWTSPRMRQEISLVRWGHYGTPVLLLATAGGDAEEVERHHLITHLQDLIDAGRIKVYSCDSVAGKAMTRGDGDVAYRAWMLNQFQQAVAHEVVPAIHADSAPQPVIVAGASIGAFNAVALISRFPELFKAAIGMSGTYDVEKFIGGYTDDLYFASPKKFLPGLEGDQLTALRQRFVLIASGQGEWEDIGESWDMAKVLGDKGIPNRVDPWGTEWKHDWPTWWAMLPGYLRELAG